MLNHSTMSVNWYVVPCCLSCLVNYLVDRTLLNKKKDLQLETKKGEELNKIVGYSATILITTVTRGSDKFIDWIKEAPTNDSLKTEDVNLGWKKAGDAFRGSQI